MRLVVTLFFALLMLSKTYAQSPVSWNYGAKKTADKTYEIQLTAAVQAPWHIYSQTTPEGGPLATKIVFKSNPLVLQSGKLKEVGDLKQKHEDVFDVDVKYFDNTVTFVQVVKLKNKVKTALSGSIEYMVCTDKQCLPPRTIDFTVAMD